ncbi:MAG: sigma 54-interacting transcriptional regulator [Candidatus Competibacteraceae bacterium]|nr:sigma 54-interacting transcriptional regulator [Candidatus Competibacteraceae bacterium]
MNNPTATEQIPIPGRTRSIRLEAIDLTVLSGPDAGLEASFCLPGLRIGSATDNDLVLTDRTVSRHHMELQTTPQGLLLRDLNSTNGTFINDLRVAETFLGNETECVLGYTRLMICQRTEERQVAVRAQDRLGPLVGGSGPMRELYGLLQAVAPTPVTVMIQGESGSGKELVAQTLHELSGRQGPLVVFDASVTDLEMVRNDLFGHVKGAFTGATGTREGAFRQAHGGTLFIDEIGELPLELQPRLLRVLETRQVTPIGADQPSRVDVRVVCATHRNLEAMVQEGSFRADLYYRLCVVPVQVPPLRWIREDIPLLVEHFRHSMELPLHLSATALEALQRYHWPGNVRELRNVLERAAVLSQGREVRPEHLHLPGGQASQSDPLPSTPDQAGFQPPAPPSPGQDSADARAQLKDLERNMIMEAMARNGNNKAAVARELGIPLSTLKRRLKDYRL